MTSTFRQKASFKFLDDTCTAVLFKADDEMEDKVWMVLYVGWRRY